MHIAVGPSATADGLSHVPTHGDAICIYFIMASNAEVIQALLAAMPVAWALQQRICLISQSFNIPNLQIPQIAVQTIIS